MSATAAQLLGEVRKAVLLQTVGDVHGLPQPRVPRVVAARPVPDLVGVQAPDADRAEQAAREELPDDGVAALADVPASTAEQSRGEEVAHVADSGP